jgi:hypothetical protein
MGRSWKRKIAVVRVPAIQETNPGWRGHTPAKHSLVLTASVEEMLEIKGAFRGHQGPHT